MAIKIAINGFGRIGRNIFKIALEKKRNWEIVAINDLTNPDTLAHLLRYDSLYGKFKEEIQVSGDTLIVEGKKIKIFAEEDPRKLPWKDLGVDIVVEATGIFRSREKAIEHIKMGAKKVIISAPGEDEDITLVMGVNDQQYRPNIHHIISNASCTTNCLAPLVKILDEEFGVERGLMTTVHAYTNDQKILDLPHNDLRRGRAAAQSIIPTTTGAADAVSLVLPRLKGKLNGIAMRVPTPTVSVVDLVVELGRTTTVEEINLSFKRAASGELKGILDYSEEALVSVDYKGNTHSSIVDALSTMIMGGNLIKIIAWYDNEWGYSARIVDLVELIAGKEL